MKKFTSICQDKTKVQENTRGTILKFKGRLEYTTNNEIDVQIFT